MDRARGTCVSSSGMRFICPQFCIEYIWLSMGSWHHMKQKQLFLFLLGAWLWVEGDSIGAKSQNGHRVRMDAVTTAPSAPAPFKKNMFPRIPFAMQSQSIFSHWEEFTGPSEGTVKQKLAFLRRLRQSEVGSSQISSQAPLVVMVPGKLTDAGDLSPKSRALVWITEWTLLQSSSYSLSRLHSPRSFHIHVSLIHKLNPLVP